MLTGGSGQQRRYPYFRTLAVNRGLLSLGRGTLIGMGGLRTDGAEIGEYDLVGAGSIVTENTKIPPILFLL